MLIFNFVVELILYYIFPDSTSKLFHGLNYMFFKLYLIKLILIYLQKELLKTTHFLLIR